MSELVIQSACVGPCLSLVCSTAICELHRQVIKIPLCGTRLLPDHPYSRRGRVSISYGSLQRGGEVFFVAYALPRLRGPLDDKGYFALQAQSMLAYVALKVPRSCLSSLT